MLPHRFCTGPALVHRGEMAESRGRMAMHLNANLPAGFFGVPTAQVVEVGLEIEI
jgi:hypothetical protein